MGRLVRSQDDVVFGGVLGGIAQWAGLDATLVRVAFALVSILSSAFPGLLVYLVMWVVIPAEE